MSLQNPKEKKLKLAHFIAGFVVLAGAGHALTTVLYLLPASPLGNATAAPVYRYMNTIFSQNWHLFSPHPGSSYLRLQVRCEQSQNKWSDWIDPLAKIEAEHFQTRITGRGKVLYVYRRIGEGVWDDFAAVHKKCRPSALNKGGAPLNKTAPARQEDFCLNESTIKQWVRSRPKFQLAQRLADSTCRALDSKASETHSQIRLARFEPVAYSERNKQKPSRQVILLPFYETPDAKGETQNEEL